MDKGKEGVGEGKDLGGSEARGEETRHERFQSPSFSSFYLLFDFFSLFFFIFSSSLSLPSSRFTFSSITVDLCRAPVAFP